MSTAGLYVALVHHPVINRRGEEVAAALTNLDLHDLARAARTFGAAAVYVVTPVEDQVELAEAIKGHWTRGAGSETNPLRREAMELLRLKGSLEEAIDEVALSEGESPFVAATAARPGGPVVGVEKLREVLASPRPVLLIFGTAWGLSRRVLEAADCVLEPITGTGAYNHLSVRQAAAIYLDRLSNGRGDG
jgi:hypothetical protein